MGLIFTPKLEQMINPIYIDFETYSSEDIKTGGAYRYTSAIDFEILLVGYAVGDGDVVIVDVANDSAEWKRFKDVIQDERYTIVAHNAQFERLCLKAYGINIPAKRFLCTASLALYAGFPESLKMVSEALNLKEGKKGTGLALIKFFCLPQQDKAGNTYRNYMRDFPEKAEEFMDYLRYDVLSEREAYHRLEYCDFPESEREVYALDQYINDAGIKIDTELATNAEKINNEFCDGLKNRIKDLYGISSLKSTAQLKNFCLIRTGKSFDSFRKEDIDGIIEECNDEQVADVLESRKLSIRPATPSTRQC